MKNMGLKAAREKAGLTQSQVAKKARIAERMYQHYEYGMEPSVRTAIRIAKALKIKTLKEFYIIFGLVTLPDCNQVDKD